MSPPSRLHRLRSRRLTPAACRPSRLASLQLLQLLLDPCFLELATALLHRLAVALPLLLPAALGRARRRVPVLYPRLVMSMQHHKMRTPENHRPDLSRRWSSRSQRGSPPGTERLLPDPAPHADSWHHPLPRGRHAHRIARRLRPLAPHHALRSRPTTRRTPRQPPTSTTSTPLFSLMSRRNLSTEARRPRPPRANSTR